MQYFIRTTVLLLVHHVIEPIKMLDFSQEIFENQDNREL